MMQVGVFDALTKHGAKSERVYLLQTSTVVSANLYDLGGFDQSQNTA